MLQPATLSFLLQLKENNNKAWFDENRPKYLAAKTDFENLTAEVLSRFSEIDNTLAHLTPKNCTFRINRDVRFSKNKSPYKTNLSMNLSAGGKKIISAGYYFHCEPGQAFVAGGVWMPMAPELKKIRQEIDYNYADLGTILSDKNFTATFGALDREQELSRPPKGYDADNPAIELLRLKSFVAIKTISDAQLYDAKLPDLIVESFRTLQPLIKFLNQALVPDAD